MTSSLEIRIGAVSYLNTKPLVYQLESFASNAELTFDLPSRLADKLASRELDVALIPSIETLQNEEYSVVSDACIACHGPVWSVRLLSRVPFQDVKTIALDEGSRTSVSMTRILFDLKFGFQPETSNLSIDADPENVDTDAVLIIGDRAMTHASDHFPFDWDLGQQWTETTNLPFVFAMWTARKDCEPGDVGFRLARARDAGLENLEQIAEVEAVRYKLDSEQCLSYLRDNLHFQLGPREYQGLALFRKHAVRLGLAPEEVKLDFYDYNPS